jgi:hypothetical protein
VSSTSASMSSCPIRHSRLSIHDLYERRQTEQLTEPAIPIHMITTGCFFVACPVDSVEVDGPPSLLAGISSSSFALAILCSGGGLERYLKQSDGKVTSTHDGNPMCHITENTDKTMPLKGSVSEYNPHFQLDPANASTVP